MSATRPPARNAIASALTAASLSITAIATLAATVILAASPRAGDHTFILVYPPWTTAAAATAAAVAAGGHLLGFPGPAFMIAIEAQDRRFLARARSGGAVLIVARKALGCSHASEDPTSC